MRKIACIVIVALTISSCGNTWDSEIKDMFHQSCMEDAMDRAKSEKHAKDYCDCVLQNVMEKYPKYEDALNNIDSVTNDAEVQRCKQGNFK